MKGYVSYYQILGVSENASNHELRKAFCRLSIELHPDTTCLEIVDAKNKFQKVLEAYENLNDKDLRRLYDEKLKASRENQNKIKKNVLNNSIIDANNQNYEANRRPFSNGEMFSLLLLIIIILVSLFGSIIVAYFTSKELDTIPIWLLK